MYPIVEIILALLAVVGLFWLGWLLLGRLLVTGDGDLPVYMVVPVTGDGQALEQTVNGLLWLRNGYQGNLTVVIADYGLTPEGRMIAQHLTEQSVQVALCPKENLVRYLNPIPTKEEREV